MREIEFRGENIKNGELVYGFLRYSCAENSYYIDYEYKESYESSAVWLFDKVDPNTIGQYTGLKDKNGNKIFEGDIIVLSNDSVKGEIFFNEKISAFQLRYLGELGELFEPKFLGEWITCYSIVGNIHDNPELLQN